MSQILVRNLSPETVDKLKKQAKRNNRSLEAEVRDILNYAANQQMTPAYARYLDDIAAGKNRRTAFLDFIEERRRTSVPQHSDSTELVWQARDELDARIS